MRVQCHERPHALVAALVQEQLERVPQSNATGQKEARAAGVYPSLSSYTFHTWFRCVIAHVPRACRAAVLALPSWPSLLWLTYTS
jgi:hypothetical protein